MMITRDVLALFEPNENIQCCLPSENIPKSSLDQLLTFFLFRPFTASRKIGTRDKDLIR